MRWLPLLLLALGTADAGPKKGASTRAEAISTDRKNPTTVWLHAPVAPLDAWKTNDCERVRLEGATLPAGIRAKAHLNTDACGETWVFLDLEVETGPKSLEYANVLLEDISLEPPKKPPAVPEDGPTRYVYGGRDEPEPAMPLDDPEWEELYWLGSWEPVTALDAEAGIVRTAGGRLLLTSSRWLEEERTALPTDKERYLAHLGYFQAGRVAREAEAGPLRSTVPAEELLADPKAWMGRPFVFQIHDIALRDAQYTEAWLEPVGQVHERACSGRRSRWDGCGAYYLDYTAFGSWRPDRSPLVVAVFTGVRTIEGRKLPVLEVMVREPWGSRTPLQVAPRWDGADE